jgi:hypothetical protein
MSHLKSRFFQVLCITAGHFAGFERRQNEKSLWLCFSKDGLDKKIGSKLALHANEKELLLIPNPGYG